MSIPISDVLTGDSFVCPECHSQLMLDQTHNPSVLEEVTLECPCGWGKSFNVGKDENIPVATKPYASYNHHRFVVSSEGKMVCSECAHTFDCDESFIEECDDYKYRLAVVAVVGQYQCPESKDSLLTRVTERFK